MAQDFFIKSGGNFDWELENGTTIILCPTEEALTRQRTAINLKFIKGEWFANINFGVPYFQSIFGKGTEAISDSIFKRTIRDTEGIVRLTDYESSLDNTTRRFTVTFSAVTETGVITNEEVVT